MSLAENQKLIKTKQINQLSSRLLKRTPVEDDMAQFRQISFFKQPKLE